MKVYNFAWEIFTVSSFQSCITKNKKTSAALEPNDKPKQREFAEESLVLISEDEAFLK